MKRTSNALRFGYFAAGHLKVSLVWAAVFLAGLTVLNHPGEQTWFRLVFSAIAMLSYLPVGWHTARKQKWNRPNRQESIWAVCVPALAAWLWASLGFFFLWMGEAPGGSNFGFAMAWLLLAPLLLLALPSALFGIECMAYLPLPVNIFLAGLLPPLLFWLGSRLGARDPALPPTPEHRS